MRFVVLVVDDEKPPRCHGDAKLFANLPDDTLVG